jgi:hypothetical protein
LLKRLAFKLVLCLNRFRAFREFRVAFPFSNSPTIPFIRVHPWFQFRFQLSSFYIQLSPSIRRSGLMDGLTYLARAKRVRRAQNCAKKRIETPLF